MSTRKEKKSLINAYRKSNQQKTLLELDEYENIIDQDSSSKSIF